MFSTVLICKYQMRIQSSPDMHSVAHCASAITVDTLFHHPPHRPANLPAAIALPQMGLDLTRNIELVLLTYNNTANRAFFFLFQARYEITWDMLCIQIAVSRALCLEIVNWPHGVLESCGHLRAWNDIALPLDVQMYSTETQRERGTKRKRAV